MFEFLEPVGPLSDPARFGGAAEDAFDVVVPSIPGYGFSSEPQAPIGYPTVARLWHRLLTDVLGYTNFGAQGGDLGSGVTRELAIDFPRNVVGIHVNGISAVTMPPDGGSEEEKRWQAANQRERAFTKDQLLTNIMIYLVTETAGTAVWLYRGVGDEPAHTPPGGTLNTPLGFASFPAEMPPLNPPRTLVERNHNLVHDTKMPKGGHFACLEQPALFVEDVRAFFRKVRS